jgi:hypothetical protein
VKCSWKEARHHQLHIMLGSSRAATPAYANLVNTRPIDNGHDDISICVTAPRLRASESKVGSSMAIAATNPAFFFITFVLSL